MFGSFSLKLFKISNKYVIVVEKSVTMHLPSAIAQACDFCFSLPNVTPIHWRATICQEVPLSEDSWLFIPVAYKLLLFYAYYNKQQADLFWDACLMTSVNK